HYIVVCYWLPFVTNARSPWTGPQTTPDDDNAAEHGTILKQGRQIIGISPVDNYIYCPVELESICLYDSKW
ncbi:hypothetical protein L208DRAFT_1288056, partial [Tricholoma matsutake]